MGSGYYPQLRSILLANGCYFLRQAKGSHEYWFSPISQKQLSLSVTVNSRTTANKLLKEAGINRKV